MLDELTPSSESLRTACFAPYYLSGKSQDPELVRVSATVFGVAGACLPAYLRRLRRGTALVRRGSAAVLVYPSCGKCNLIVSLRAINFSASARPSNRSRRLRPRLIPVHFPQGPSPCACEKKPGEPRCSTNPDHLPPKLRSRMPPERDTAAELFRRVCADTSRESAASRLSRGT